MSHAKILRTVFVSILLLTASSAFAQIGELQRRIATASRITCNFSTLVTGDWEDGAPTADVGTTDLEVEFFDINIDEGTAEADSRFGPSFIVVRYSNDYLHLVQMFNSGPLYVTTIIANEVSDGRLMATHTRHEFTPTRLIGFTSRPEMYVGDCAALSE